MSRLTGILLKTLAGLMLVLLILWTFSPQIIRWIIGSQLPAEWQLDKITINRPDFNGLEIVDASISSPAQNIEITALELPFSATQTIQLKNLLLHLKTTDSEASSELLFPEPIIFDRSINIEQLFLTHAEFEIKGSLKASGEAISFNGLFLSEEKILPLEANLLGFNGQQNMKLSAKLGTDQFITLNYPWQEKTQRQSLHLIANIEQQLWQMLTQSKLLPLPENLHIQQPQLAASIKLSWKQWPNNLTQLLDADFNGKAQFKFLQLTLDNWILKQNEASLDFNKSGELLLSSESPFLFKQFTEKTTTQIEFSQFQQLPINLKNSKLTVANPGIIKIQARGDITTITPTDLNYNFGSKTLSINSDIAIEINPLSIFEPSQVNNNTSIQFHTSGYFEITDQQFKINLQKSILNIAGGIQQQIWQLTKSQVEFNPINKTVAFGDSFSIDDLYQLKLNGLLSANIESPSLQLNNLCSWKLVKHLLKLQCETLSKKSSTEKIRSHIDFNIKNSLIEGMVTTEKISAKNWPLMDILPEEIVLNDFDLSTLINFKINSNELSDLTIEGLLNKLTSESYLTINDLNLKYQDITLNNGQVEMTFSDLKRLVFSLSAAEISLSSELTLTDVKGVIKPLQDQKPPVTDKRNLNQNLALSFRLFDATIDVSSDNFSVFKEDYQVQTNILQLDIDKLLAWLAIDGLSGSGKLDGSFPVTVNKEGFSLNNGQLASSNPGIIRYLPSTTEDEPTESNIAMDALKDFHYETLALKIESLNLFYHKQGDFIIPLRIVGKNPVSQFDNTFAINPKLQGSIPAETWNHLIIGSFEDRLLKK